MSRKRYYVPGVDELHQMVETPASKAKTDSRRFVITTAITVVAAVASIVAAVVAIMTISGFSGSHLPHSQ